jgi:t-SNARE complex subunit (syntaxin)
LNSQKSSPEGQNSFSIDTTLSDTQSYFIDNSTKRIKTRGDEIKKFTEEMTELNKLFRQLKDLIENQRDPLETISQNIGETFDNTEKASKIIDEVSNIQRHDNLTPLEK